jgi:hypothetical protein
MLKRLIFALATKICGQHSSDPRNLQQYCYCCDVGLSLLVAKGVVDRGSMFSGGTTPGVANIWPG